MERRLQDLLYQKQTFIAIIILGFLLGNYKGYLALWKENTPDPFQIFPLCIESLPEEDQNALEKGIPARSELELQQLLEDYLS